jgi:hypothetical protein
VAAQAPSAAFVIGWMGRGWRVFYDERGVIEYRRAGVVRVLRSATPYRMVELGAHLVLAALLFAYLLGRLPALVALALTTVFLYLGVAWELLLWMRNLGFVLPLVMLLVALLVRDRFRGLGADVAVAAAAAVALASFGLGIAVEAAPRRAASRPG